MGNVYVNDWNGYPGGIYRTFDNALESMAIHAVYKGVEGYAKHEADLKDEIEELVKLGIGGSRIDRHLYSIVTSGNYEFFSISSHDIDVRPGYSAEVATIVSSEIGNPKWAVQKALFDFATLNFDDIDSLTDLLYAKVEEQVENALRDHRDADAALRALTVTTPTFAEHLDGVLIPSEVTDAASILEALPERAVEVFQELAARAYPEAFEPEAQTPGQA
jgi:hypothetical protein